MMRRGLSYLELIVVMAIILIVVAMLTPPVYHLVKYVRSLGSGG